MKTILVQYDSNDMLKSVVDTAITLTGANQCSVTFAHIADKSKPDNKKLQDELNKLVKSSAIPQNVSVNYIMKEGKSHVEIVNIAKDINADSIVMKADAKKSFSFFGDHHTYEAVITAPCPVITLGQHSDLHNIKKIILPIDTSPESRQKIPMAINLAKNFNAEIHILAYGSDSQSHDSRIKLENYGEQSRHFILEKGVKVVLDHAHGKNMVDMVLNYINKNKGDILIITAEEDISIFSNSAAEKLIHKCPVPVMSIQPKDLKVSYAAL